MNAPADCPWPDRDDELRELHAIEPALSTAEIGRRMDLTKGSVGGRIRRLKLVSRHKPVLVDTQRARRIRERRAAKRAGVEGTAAAPKVERLASAPAPTGRRPGPYREPHARGCQWHLGRDGLEHLFCGAPVDREFGGSWCFEHRAIVMRPPSAYTAYATAFANAA